MRKRGILFVISGPSGVGKGTLRTRLMEMGMDLAYSVSATTRKPRAGEIDGRDYFFMDEDKFKGMIERGEFLEYAVVYNHYYGTPRAFVERLLAQGQDVLLEIDINGARQVREKMADGVFIFIMPPSLEELTRRLLERGKDSEEEIKKRLQCYEEEVSQVKNYDYVVVNECVKEAVDYLAAIVKAERCRVNRWLAD